VREVDALGGLMAAAADAAGIHFRLLNASRGPAVRGPRAQMDRAAYKAAVQAALRALQDAPGGAAPGGGRLQVVDGVVADLLLARAGAPGGRPAARGVLLATGGRRRRGLGWGGVLAAVRRLPRPSAKPHALVPSKLNPEKPPTVRRQASASPRAPSC
jgi:hypothetical protein